MRLLIELDETPTVVDLVSFEPQTTVSQLVEVAIGHPPAPGERLFLDAAEVTPDAELRGLTMLEGSRLGRIAQPPAAQIPGWNVAVVAGLTAGAAQLIPVHRQMILGRSPHADLVLPTESASWSHCTMELDGDGVRVRDVGSTNGTFIDGQRIDEAGIVVTETTLIVIGGTVLAVRPRLVEPAGPAPGSLHNLTPAATAPFNRPPRPGRSKPPEPIEPPTALTVRPAAKFNMIAVAVPLIMAAVLVVVLGDLRFALFALLSPIMAVGMYFEQKRRYRRDVRDEEARYAQALDDLQAQIAEAARAEAARLHQTTPDPSVVLRRPLIPSTQLWHRRTPQPDRLALLAGIGDVPWEPELDLRGTARLDARVKAVVEQGRMPTSPVVIDLGDAGVVGIVGDRTGALALARSLVLQATVHVGPADLTAGAFCDAGREADWSWAAWLPHTRQGIGDGTRWLSSSRAQSTEMLRALLDKIDGLPTPLLLLVLDSELLTEGRDAPARDLLGYGRRAHSPHARGDEPAKRVAGIVLATSREQLPASCTTVIEVGADAACSVHAMDAADPIEDMILTGVGAEDAAACARALARFDDPELVLPGATLPSAVQLSDLLNSETLSPELILDLWRSSMGTSVPIGIGENGLFTVDLVHDGPHGVVAGTTGSGKSEILKTLLASLVAHLTPEDLNLILVDFKGGAAFAAFEHLPHTIGTISNLDEQLADRAIRALQAEMRRRQRLFSAAGEGVENLPAYLATNPAEPLPRLLFIVDEFKELVKDHPDVLASLVSVAAIGRTLGVHMILATQQPAGVVSDAILANSNLRIAARVQRAEDSSSVISDGSAATISRFHRGRAYMQRGVDDLELVQTAYVSAPRLPHDAPQIEVRRVEGFGAAPAQPDSEHAHEAETDLDALVNAVIAANRIAGHAPPRRVWPEVLGERVALAGYRQQPAELVAGAITAPPIGGLANRVVHVALLDDPDEQRQIPYGWNLDEGNLLLIGVPGSGTSTTLASLALSLAASLSPADVDVLCLDKGSRGLAPLAGLPHSVAYVGSGANASEQQTRFLRHLSTEFSRRRASNAPERPSVYLIDGFTALRDELQDPEGLALLDAFARVYADGPSVGMHFAVSTTRGRVLPSAMDEVTTQRWVFRLADNHDYSALGITGAAKPAPIAGRCVSTTTKLQMHIATPEFGVEAAVAEARSQWAAVPAKPNAIGAFPDHVPATLIADELRLGTESCRIPVGIREDTLEVAALEVFEGEHLLISGPSRSGKSTLLGAIAAMLRALPDESRPALWGIFGRRSPLRDAPLDRIATTAEDIPPLLAGAFLESRRIFLFIDDAHAVADDDGALATLVGSVGNVCVIAAGLASDLSKTYGHWTNQVRKSRCGVLLMPDTDLDGELFRAKLPRSAPVAITPGRGYACVAGAVALMHAASPTESKSDHGRGAGVVWG